MTATGFSDKGASSEKTSELASRLHGGAMQELVKGQDERHRTAPLTSSCIARQSCARKRLTTNGRVIHGMIKGRVALFSCGVVTTSVRQSTRGCSRLHRPGQTLGGRAIGIHAPQSLRDPGSGCRRPCRRCEPSLVAQHSSGCQRFHRNGPH
jgi:hypothetical protein